MAARRCVSRSFPGPSRSRHRHSHGDACERRHQDADVTGLALAMVLASAVFHAVWNLFAKQARGGVVFVWMADSLSIALFAPAAALVLLLQPARVDGVALGFIAGSALLHLTYFVLLQRGYGAGDLSLVYPLARGTGPVL